MKLFADIGLPKLNVFDMLLILVFSVLIMFTSQYLFHPVCDGVNICKNGGSCIVESGLATCSCLPGRIPGENVLSRIVWP